MYGRNDLMCGRVYYNECNEDIGLHPQLSPQLSHWLVWETNTKESEVLHMVESKWRGDGASKQIHHLGKELKGSPTPNLSRS